MCFWCVNSDKSKAFFAIVMHALIDLIDLCIAIDHTCKSRGESPHVDWYWYEDKICQFITMNGAPSTPLAVESVGAVASVRITSLCRPFVSSRVSIGT